jgi:hypothetical protein
MTLLRINKFVVLKVIIKIIIENKTKVYVRPGKISWSSLTYPVTTNEIICGFHDFWLMRDDFS